MHKLISKAAVILRNGGLVAIPTETVYGLAANAFDARAVARIFEVKRRPFFDPLIVHIGSTQEMTALVEEMPVAARQLAERFWPGPLTMVLTKNDRVPDLVTSGLPTVAIRMPDHDLTRALISQTGFPLAAPSANLFGSISPTTAAHVRDQLGSSVDFILDGGPCPVGIESTILSFRSGKPVLLRSGGLPLETIESEIGPVEVTAGSEVVTIPEAPGQLPRHYAPRTPLHLLKPDEKPIITGRAGWIGLNIAEAQVSNYAATEILSAKGDLREAAANLFAALHRLDGLGLDVIYAATVPAEGLGYAINDRFRRAATPETADNA